MKQTMLWMLGLCMAILPTGPQAMGNTTPAVNAASVDEVAVNAMPADAVVDETTKSAVCDTIFMTWTAEAGKEKTFYFAGPESENYTFVVDWGDGTKEEVVDVKDEEYPGSSLFLTAVRHAYASDGIYVVKLYGMVSQAMLKALYCVSVQVTSLDVSRSADLYFLECVSNSLTSLNVSRNAGLTYLRCFQNRLSVLDVSHNPLLAYLECSGNSLTSLDVSQNTALEILGCGSNQLTSLDVSQNIALTALGCGSNQLTSLDVSQNTALASLGCKNNQLSSLNLSRNTALVGLDCSNNQLSSLDISKNTALVGLDCSNNQLSSLDISRNTVLTQLECYNNQLSSLDVSRNTALEELYCHNNPLAALNLSKNANLSTLRWYGSREVVLDEDNGLDMNVLAGVEVERVKDVTGGHIEGSRMIFEANSVMYEYSTGCQNQDSVVVFILTASEPLAPSDVQSGDMLFMTWAPLEDQVKVFWFQGTASEDFIIDWGDGEKEVVTGQGISDDFYDPMQESAMVNGICMRHQYKLDGSRIEYSVKIIGQSPDARIEKFHCTPDHANNVRLLDVRNCPKLKELYCYNTWMAVWDLRLNEELEKTKLSSLSQAVSYSSLRLGHHPFLTYLSVRGRLQVLDVSRSPLLTYLECDGNQLTSLDVSRNTALTHLDCDNNQLASLDVSRNTALTYLACGHNQLTSLDVSLNTALRKLYCANNQLTSLDVFQNTALTELFCYNNQLSSLDLSQNTALEWLYCSNNQLSSLDVSQNTALFILHCAKNRLTSLDLSRNLTLADLDFGEDLLTVDLDTVNSFDLSTLPGLDVSRIGSVTGGRLEGSRLIFEEERVTYHYATHFPGEASLGFDSVEFTLVASAPLTPTEPEEPTDPTDAVCDTIFMTWTAEAGEENAFRFSGTEHCAFYVNWGDGNDTMVIGTEIWTNDDLCYGQKLRHSYAEAGSYDVMLAAPAANTSIKTFGCGGNNVTVLDVSRSTALTELSCGFNQLAVLDVSANTALLALYCDDNLLTSLDVGQNTALTVLSCFNNQLTSLDVRANMALEFLDCRINQLTALDVSQNTALGYVGCSDNQLTALDVSNNMVLTALDCYVNQLTSLEVSANTALKYLLCGNNQLTDLDVSQNTALMELSCGFNQLTTLDVSKNTALTKLACHYNQLTSLELNRNIALTELECYNNQLTMLDLNKNTDLVELWCDDNLLSSLDLSRCPNLEALGCYGNTRTVLISTDRTFDMTLLPGMDVSRIGSMTGGRLENSQLIFETEWVTYRYATHFSGDASRGFDSVEFTLIASESITPPTDPTLPSDTLAPEHGAGWIWMASAGEEKEMTFKGTGKGFRVDWGDGSTDEAKGGVAMVSGADGAASMASLDCAASASAFASKDSEKELKHRYAEEGVYTVQLIPLSQNGRLTDLEVSEEQVLALAFGDASMLETLDCSDNLLTELALPAAAKLKDLDCSENLLAALDLSGCAALQVTDFSDNRLTSVTLPTHARLKAVEGEDNRLRLSSLYGLLSGRVKNASYGFDPQSDSVTVTENAVFDLASEMTFGGRATTYTLLDAATCRPVPASDYAADGGLFRFFKPGARYLLTLRNANVTDYEKGRAATPVAFTYHVYVSGVANEDLASDEAAAAPWAYVQGRTIYLTEPVGGAGLGEVEAFTAVGQRVYRGFDRAFTVPTVGVYVLRAADGRRCKVMVK